MDKPFPKSRLPRESWEFLLPGLGAVSTTFMAGVELVRKGKAQPVGSHHTNGHHSPGQEKRMRAPR